MAGKLNVEIVTGERVVFQEQDVDMVVAPGGAGVLGILPEHAPLITTLSLGELRIKKGNDEQSILVYGGVMEGGDKKGLLLADPAPRRGGVDRRSPGHDGPRGGAGVPPSRQPPPADWAAARLAANAGSRW